nr:hypothetical protein [Tanacetum cinerariifolium]
MTGTSLSLSGWEDCSWTTDLVVVACIIELERVRVLERLVENRYVPCLLVQWNNTEVDWQTETRMSQDFPHFENASYPSTTSFTRRTSGAHLTLVGSCGQR